MMIMNRIMTQKHDETNETGGDKTKQQLMKYTIQ